MKIVATFNIFKHCTDIQLKLQTTQIQLWLPTTFISVDLLKRNLVNSIHQI